MHFFQELKRRNVIRVLAGQDPKAGDYTCD